MNNQIDTARMAEYIGRLRQTAEALQKMGKDLPAVEKNVARILASVKMLELNVCDPVEFLDKQGVPDKCNRFAIQAGDDFPRSGPSRDDIEKRK